MRKQTSLFGSNVILSIKKFPDYGFQKLTYLITLCWFCFEEDGVSRSYKNKEAGCFVARQRA